MNEQIRLLNPFSIKLEINPFMTTNSSPVYINGDFRVYKFSNKHFLHTFKNIIIAELGAINKDVINNVKNDIIPPLGDGKRYHQYDRPKEAMLFGIDQANKLNFEII